ncbi:hypothetical protein [Amycolatopsis circi]|uniref:hypothetical protein n=1 Tax=Amycolatopsis circi TaxID=871959 RepID=UPI000E2810EC|nr:hypothetical protein [Amycolatopsis circi]
MPALAKPRRLLVVTAVLVLVVAAVVVYLTTRSDDEPVAETATSSPASAPTSFSPPSSTAKPAPLDAAGYQKLLTDIGASITPAVQQLGQATTSAAVRDAGTNLTNAAGKAIEKLDAATPPDAISGTHRSLMTDLNVLYNSSVSKIVSDAVSNKLCGGISATAALSRDQGIAGLRGTLAKLTAAGYHLGPLFPDPQPDPNRGAANGAVLTGAGGGKNTISVKNSSGTDQAVTLADGRSAVFTVYVKAGATASASGIADGSYTAYSTGGTDWDAANGRFTRDCSFSKFSQAASMKDNGYTHTNLDLTVREIDPYATSSSLSPEQTAIEAADYPR